MNKCFRTLWNSRKQAWVAVAETVKSKGKPSTAPRVAVVSALLFSALMDGQVFAQAPPPNAIPTGGQVSAGQASIRQTGANVVIDQSSDRAAIHWQSFDVGSNAQVQFNQPSVSSLTLNRVLSANPSQIFGRITANGQVILSNPQGVYFGPSARVDVGGLIATTHGISDADFMAGQLHFGRNGNHGRVLNEGELKAALGGYIALLAPEVRNQGAVIAQMGTVAMASGEAVDLYFDRSNRLSSIRVAPSQIQALVDNRMAVQAPGGLVILSAQSVDQLIGGVVNNSGAVEATGMQQDGGRIVLSASKRLTHTGSLDVSSTQAGGRAGNISLQGEHIELAEGGRLLATGPAGGGTVLVGGNWQGSADPLLQATGQPTEMATTVAMGSDVSIDASATHKGDGGTVVVWSDVTKDQSVTVAKGSIKAEGGAQGGDGGRVETSGHNIDINDVQVSTRAPMGRSGLFLLDPYDLVINNGGNWGVSNIPYGTLVVTQSPGTANYNYQSLGNLFNGNGNVSLTAAGTITFQSGFPNFYGGTSSFTVSAGVAINVNAALGGVNGDLSLSAPTININANIRNTGYGNISLTSSGGGAITGNGAIQIGPTTAGSAGTLTINTGAGTSGTLSGVISGYGGVTKTGVGSIILSGNNTYMGATQVSGGSLNLGHVNALGATTASAVTVDNGATLELNGFSPSVGSLAGAGTVTNNGASNSVLNLGGNNTSTTFSGVIRDGTKQLSLEKNGVGIFILSGANTYSGTTTVHAGALTLTSPGALYGASSGNLTGWTTSNIIVNSGATLGLTVGGAGAFSSTDVDTLAQLGSSSGGFKAGSFLGLDTSAGDFTYTSTLTNPNSGANAFGLNKLGPNILTLGGTQNYTGGTTVTGGTLLVSSPSALYNSTRSAWTASNLKVLSGATLAMSVGTGLFSTADLDLLVDLGTSTGGFLSGSFLGLDTGAEDFFYNTVIANPGGNQRGLVKLGTSRLTLGGSNSYTGATPLSMGTLVANSASALGNGSAVSLASGTTLDLNGFSLQLGSLAGSGLVTSGASGSVTLSAGEDGSSTTFSGIVQDGMGTVGLSKAGGGTWTLSGANTYTGVTTVSMGTLVQGADNALGTNEVEVSGTGAVLDLNGKAFSNNLTLAGTGIATNGALINSSATELALSGTVTLTSDSSIGGAGNLTLNGLMDGTGALTKVGGNTLTLGAANTYLGTTTVNTGTLKLSVSQALGNNSVAVNTGAVLDLAGFDASNNLSLTGTGSGSGALLNSSATASTLTGSVALSAASSIGGTGNLTVNGVVSGSTFALTKVGTNTLILGGVGDNTYGSLVLSAGTVKQAKNNALGGSAVTVSTGAVLDLGGSNANNNVTITGTGGGIGALINSGATGSTLTGSVALSAASSIGGTGNLSVNGVVSGSFALTKVGSNTLTLGGVGNNTYSSLAVTVGTVKQAKDNALGSGTVTVSSGAVLDMGGSSASNALSLRGTGIGSNGVLINSGATASTVSGAVSLAAHSSIGGSSNLTVSNVISGSGFSLTKVGGNSLILSGNNTYTGGTTISGGTLQVGDAGASGALGSGTATLSNNANLSFVRSTSTTISNTINGNGNVSATITGGTGSALTLSGAGISLTTGNIDLNTTGGLVVNAPIANASATGNITLNAGGAGGISGNANGNIQIGPASGSAGTLTFNTTHNNANGSIAGIISGAGGITKLGSGALGLGGKNTYSGATTVNSGTLNINNFADFVPASGAPSGFPFSIRTSALNVAAGSILNINSSAKFYNSQYITVSGAGRLALNGGAIWTTERGGVTLRWILVAFLR